MYSSSTHLYALWLQSFSCCQSRVPKSQVQLAIRAMYFYDNRDPINQGHVLFFAFHFDLSPFSDGQLSKVSAQPTVFNGEICCLQEFILPMIKF